MNNLQEVIKKENDFIFNVGGVLELTEFDQNLNDIQREKISEYKKTLWKLLSR